MEASSEFPLPWETRSFILIPTSCSTTLEQATRNKVRTAPLWGLRIRTRLMHDGVSVTFSDAILRHGGEASFVIDNYRALTSSQKKQLLAFLGSL